MRGTAANTEACRATAQARLHERLAHVAAELEQAMQTSADELEQAMQTSADELELEVAALREEVGGGSHLSHS